LYTLIVKSVQRDRLIVIVNLVKICYQSDLATLS